MLPLMCKGTGSSGKEHVTEAKRTAKDVMDNGVGDHGALAILLFNSALVRKPPVVNSCIELNRWWEYRGVDTLVCSNARRITSMLEIVKANQVLNN
jgi:hypothetical protein